MVFTSRNWFAMQGSVAIILISWNVIFIWETGYLLDQGYKKIRLIRSHKKFIFRYQDLVEIYSVSVETIINNIVKMYKDKEVNKNVKNILLSTCDVKVFLTFTSLNWVLLWQLVLPMLFQYCYKFCYSDNRNLWAVMKAGVLAL